MSSPSPVQDGQTLGGVWSSLVPYVSPPVSAMGAIVPVFYGFIAKSALQKGLKIPFMTFKSALIAGVKASPSVGVLVGSQIITQDILERSLVRWFGNQSMSVMVVSSFLVGAASAPSLAVFNGYTNTVKKTARESLRALSIRQTLAVAALETSFLLSIRFSNPLNEYMKERCGTNRVTDVAASFISGAIGSVVGYPADTTLTRLQNNLPIKPRDLMRGAPIKAVTLGCFTVLYNQAKDAFKSI